jgi:hypothetical protein
MSRNRLIVILTLLSLFAAGCAGMPRQIASYPQEKTIAVYPAVHGSYVYNAYLELEVRRPNSTAERAIELTEDYGGYLSDSQSWWTDGDEQDSLELMVPAINFEGLYEALQRLGTLTSEHVYARWDGSGDGWSVYSQISLMLRSQTSHWPSISLVSWHPVDTLRQAWEVSTSIFGFLFDLLIWVVVVVGPFVLIGLGVRKLYLKLRQ